MRLTDGRPPLPALYLSDRLLVRTVPGAGRPRGLDDLRTALDEAGLPADQVDAIVDENESARIDGLRLSLSVLALLAVVALFLTRLVPTEPVGGERVEEPRAGPA